MQDQPRKAAPNDVVEESMWIREKLNHSRSQQHLMRCRLLSFVNGSEEAKAIILHKPPASIDKVRLLHDVPFHLTHGIEFWTMLPIRRTKGAAEIDNAQSPAIVCCHTLQSLYQALFDHPLREET